MWMHLPAEDNQVLAGELDGVFKGGLSAGYADKVLNAFRLW
jgi:hypothetical protein